MNILAVSHHYPPYHAGGYGLLTHWVCEGLVGRGHRVRVLTSAPPRTAPQPQQTRLAVARLLRPVAHGQPPWRLLWNARHNAAAVRRAVREADPDLIYCTGNDGVGYGVFAAARGSGRPTLTHVGDTWLEQAARNLSGYDPWIDVCRGGRRPGARRIVKRAVGAVGRLAGVRTDPSPVPAGPVVAISRFLRDGLAAAGACPADAPFVPVPLAPDYFTPAGRPVGSDGSPSPSLRALFVSRMEPLKGPAVAIEALAVANRSGGRVTLTLAGLGQERMRPELDALAGRLGVAAAVSWAGTPALPDLVRLYQAHDVFVFPSLITEGLGIVNCEAMACGLPVVGVADSGAGEVLRHGETGLAVRKGDPGDLAAALVALADDRSLRGRLAAGALAEAERFRPDVVLARIEAAALQAAGRA